MAKALNGLLAVAAMLAATAFAQTTIRMPEWLVPYPGASGQTRSSAVLAESTYETAARPADVLAHYQKLFEAAHLSFQPSLDGIGTVIRASAAECDLLLTVRERGPATAVRVNCAAKSASMVAVPPPPKPAAAPRGSTYQERVAQMQEDSIRARERNEEKAREHIQGMEKYDQPYVPPPKAARPAPVWPRWLVGPDGLPLETQKGTDRVGMKTLTAAFVTRSSRNDIQAYYAGLLEANGYLVYSKTPPSWPQNRNATVEARYFPRGDPGPRFVIHVELTPLDQAQQAEIRMTAYP